MPFRFAFVRITAGLGTAATIALAACADSPTATPSSAMRSNQSVVGSNSSTFANFEPLANQASCSTPPAALPGFASYRPFNLPDGYSQVILADEVTDFSPVAGTGAGNPDMMTLNETGPHAGRYMYRTHEVGSNGAVTVTDLWTGATSLVAQQSHYEALDGIVWTPWGTVSLHSRIRPCLTPSAAWSTSTIRRPVSPYLDLRSARALTKACASTLRGICTAFPNRRLA